MLFALAILALVIYFILYSTDLTHSDRQVVLPDEHISNLVIPEGEILKGCTPNGNQKWHGRCKSNVTDALGKKGTMCTLFTCPDGMVGRCPMNKNGLAECIQPGHDFEVVRGTHPGPCPKDDKPLWIKSKDESDGTCSFWYCNSIKELKAVDKSKCGK